MSVNYVGWEWGGEQGKWSEGKRSRTRTLFNDFAHKYFRKSSYNLCDWLGNLLSQALLDYLRPMYVQVEEAGDEKIQHTLRTACLGNACRLYASNRSYCAGLRFSIKTL